jgi:hypothetical protein
MTKDTIVTVKMYSLKPKQDLFHFFILASGKKRPTTNHMVTKNQNNFVANLISSSVDSWKYPNQFHEELQRSNKEAPPQLTTHLV